MASIRLIEIDNNLGRIVEEGGTAFNQAYRASLGESEVVVREVVSQTLAFLRTAPRPAEWGRHLVVDRAQAVVIGTCGFKHGPEVGNVWQWVYRPGV